MRYRFSIAVWLAAVLTSVVISLPLYAADDTEAMPISEPVIEKNTKVFPRLYLSEQIQAAERAERSRPYGVAAIFEPSVTVPAATVPTATIPTATIPTATNPAVAPSAPPVSGSVSSGAALPEPEPRSVIYKDDILAFYGSPLTAKMGILGAYPIPELSTLLGDWALKYDAANGDRGVRKAFYLIYGTVWPEGEIGILKDDIVKKYIDFALANDMLVFLDHQIGKYTVNEAIKRLLPYLKYPNVHLALDPEWRTLKPMLEIGTVTADELNEAQKTMDDYLAANALPGERLLVIHQFNWRMIKNRELVKTDYNRVRFVHCADGFGPPSMKREAYRYNALATNLPVKGFKLFFNRGLPGAGYDEPLMSPEEVFALNPRPSIIMYQ